MLAARKEDMHVAVQTQVRRARNSSVAPCDRVIPKCLPAATSACTETSTRSNLVQTAYTKALMITGV